MKHFIRFQAGSVMGIPTQLGPFLIIGLVFTARVNFVRRGISSYRVQDVEGDQSLGRFFRRRFGREVVENLIEPLLSGIYAGDIDQLSLESTFPQF